MLLLHGIHQLLKNIWVYLKSVYRFTDFYWIYLPDSCRRHEHERGKWESCQCIANSIIKRFSARTRNSTISSTLVPMTHNLQFGNFFFINVIVSLLTVICSKSSIIIYWFRFQIKISIWLIHLCAILIWNDKIWSDHTL